jgi:hypothetical protein
MFSDMGDAGHNALSAAEVDKAVAALMKLGMTKDQAYSKVHEAEVRRKNLY